MLALFLLLILIACLRYFGNMIFDFVQLASFFQLLYKPSLFAAQAVKYLLFLFKKVFTNAATSGMKNYSLISS